MAVNRIPLPFPVKPLPVKLTKENQDEGGAMSDTNEAQSPCSEEESTANDSSCSYYSAFRRQIENLELLQVVSKTRVEVLELELAQQIALVVALEKRHDELKETEMVRTADLLTQLQQVTREKDLQIESLLKDSAAKDRKIAQLEKNACTTPPPSRYV